MSLCVHQAKKCRNCAPNIMSHMWLMAHMRQPEPMLTKFLEAVLTRKNFLFARQLEDQTLVGPSCVVASNADSSFEKKPSYSQGNNFLGFRQPTTQHSMIHNIVWSAGSLCSLSPTQTSRTKSVSEETHLGDHQRWHSSEREGRRRKRKTWSRRPRCGTCGRRFVFACAVSKK